MALKVVAVTNEIRALTIDDLMRRYATCNEVDGKSPVTIKWYTEILTSFSNHLKIKLGKNSLSVFNLEAVREYILYLRQKPRFQGHPYTPEQLRPLSAETLRCHSRALKAFSTWLYSEGYTTENRLKHLKLPKARKTMIEPLTPEEIKHVGSAINKDLPTGLRNYAIFVTALDTGSRASEIAGIKMGQLNLQGGYIKVMGKGAKERIVPIGKFVETTLWHYVEKIRPKPFSSDCDYLFLSRAGKPISTNAIKLMFSRLAKSAGVERLHAHLCRHTFAVNYLLNGGDIFSLREILGHTTLEMVNHYLHFTSSQITAQHHKYSPMDKLQFEAEAGPQ